ncbi:hypothetical protein ABBQ38_004802 [Trebouxia sp. C0009 RCD-2024]
MCRQPKTACLQQKDLSFSKGWKSWSLNALHTPSSIHNQLAQLQDASSQQTSASPTRQHSRHAYSQAKHDSSSHTTSSSAAAAPTPLSRSALQNAERGAASSSLKRQLPTQRSLPAPQPENQLSMPSPSQTEYRNPVFGQEEGFSPVKSGPVYAPVLTNALPARGPSPLGAPTPAARPVGDLFRPPGGSLPNVAVPNCPALPDWNQQRPYLTGQYLMDSLELEDTSGSRHQALESFSPAVQEIVVLEDLLWGFMGFEAKYIRANRERSSRGGVTFQLKGKLDHAVHELVVRMLPICEYVVVIQRFVETRSAYQWGLVCHATAASARAVLHDWNLMVTQLEHQLRTGRLTLQALWYYCQPPLASLQLLASIASEAAVSKVRGSALLNLLHQRSQAVAGDEQAHRLLQKLLHAACAPYFRVLERWLCEGVVSDPYGEFMIQEHKDINKDSVNKEDQSAYWYQRYSLRPLLDAQGNVTLAHTGAAVHDVPLFLEEAKDSILMTGKYLNAIRECGRPVERPLPPDVHIEYSSGGFMQSIQLAFATSSQALLRLLQHDLGLNNTLAALKHYFLLDKGDLLVSFLDNAEEELSKPASEVSVIRLQSLLDLGLAVDSAKCKLGGQPSTDLSQALTNLVAAAVRSSSAASDPITEKLECFLDHRSLLGMLQQRAAPKDDHTAPKDPQQPLVSPRQMPGSDPTLLRSRLGREAFLLGYKIEWPLSIVISQQAMAQYQLIFRHLFELKYVERQLNGVWQVLQATRGLFRWPSATLKRCYSLCQHMMHFFHQYLLYVTFEVLEPLWHTMSIQCRAASTLDEVIGHHGDFLRKVLKGCLLSRKLTLLQSLLQLKKQAGTLTKLTAALHIQPDDMGHSTSELDTVPKGDKTARRRSQRAEKAASVAALLQHAISDDRFAVAVQDLEASFGTHFSGFITELQDMHQAAQSDAKESREELDSLSNLIGRLDFNDYFKPKPDYRAMLANGTI